jgi:hypothetical protein
MRLGKDAWIGVLEKITEDDVMAIRSSDDLGVTLAKRYGITPTVISKIRRRLLWRHVP